MTTAAASSPNDRAELAPLRSALASWTSFDLDGRRPRLDDAAQSLVDARETSLKARKQLGERTKGLKRSVKVAEAEGTPESVNALAANCKGTIKSYQEEIDSLTRR